MAKATVADELAFSSWEPDQRAIAERVLGIGNLNFEGDPRVHFLIRSIHDLIECNRRFSLGTGTQQELVDAVLTLEHSRGYRDLCWF